MKRILSVFLAVTLMFSCISTVFAADTVSAAASASEVQAGDTFEITYTLPILGVYEDAMALGVQFTYDHDAFELRNVTGFSGSWAVFDTTGCSSWESSDVFNGDNISGKSFVAEFACKNDAEVKSYEIAIEFDSENCFDINGNEYALTGNSVFVTVIEPSHSFNGEMKDNGDGTHSFKCTDEGCGEYGNPVPHSGDWSGDDTHHWKVCACGAKAEFAAHSGGTATSTGKTTCAVCGMEYSGERYVDTVSVETGAAPVQASDTFVITCTMPATADYKDALGLGVRFNYDHNAFELKGITGLSGSWLTFASTGYGGWAASDAVNGDNISGKSFAAEFICKNDAAAKTYEIAVEFVDEDCFNSAYYEYALTGGSVFVTVTEPSHNFNGEMKDNGDGTHSFKCTDDGCGKYGNPVPHSGDWTGDDIRHWKVCACGAKSALAAHSGGTATDAENAICTVCGMEYSGVRPAATVNVSTSATQVQAGDTVRITCTMPVSADYESALSLGVQFTYDHDAFELKGVTGLSNTWLIFDATGYSSWVADDAYRGDNISGKSFVAEFACKDAAAVKTYEFATEFVKADSFDFEYIDYVLTAPAVSVAVVATPCVHNSVQTLDVVAPTCTTDGKTEGKVCEDCGTVLVAQERIPALGHNFSGEMKDMGDGTHAYKCVNAGCAEYGNAAAHSGEAWTGNDIQHWKECACGTRIAIGKHAGGTATATKRAVCSTCGMEYGELKKADIVSVTASTTDVQVGDTVRITYTFPATATYAAACGLGVQFTYDHDAFELKSMTGPSGSWVFKDVTGYGGWMSDRISGDDIGGKAFVAEFTCKSGEAEKDYEFAIEFADGDCFDYSYNDYTLIADSVFVTAHINVGTLPAVAADCTASGKTEGKFCRDCGKILVAQEVIPAKGHMVVTDPAVAATCINAGKTEGKHCSECGAVLVAQEVIPAKGHTEVTDSAVAATCTIAGKTEGKHCSECGAVLVAQNVVPAKGHTEVIDAAVKATCTTAGKTEGKHCSECNAVLVAQKTVSALGHNFNGAVKDNGNGTHSYKCTNAGCSVYGNATSHSFAWTGNADKHWKECACGAKNGEGAHYGGTATYTEKARCVVCSMEYGKLKDPEIMNVAASTTDVQVGDTVKITYTFPTVAVFRDALALGVRFTYDHDAFQLKSVSGPSGSWVIADATGYGGWGASNAVAGDDIRGKAFVAEFVCKNSAVEKTYQIAAEFISDDSFNSNFDDYGIVADSVSVTAHIHVDDLPAVTATCTTSGKTEGKVCRDCGKILVAQEVIPAKGHTEVIDPAVKATCTSEGKTQGKHCSVCGVVLVAQNVIPATGHTNTELRNVKAATCTAAGYTGDTYCKICGQIVASGSVINPTGHNYGAWTSINDKQHQRICANDVSHVEIENHHFTGSKCDECGYVIILLGDVNNDGKVNQKDVARLRQYIADSETYPLDALQNADVNNDTKINQKDVARLRQYIADPETYPLG